jgi:hypothetical protein
LWQEGFFFGLCSPSKKARKIRQDNKKPAYNRLVKTDFKKTLDSYQAKQGVFRIVTVPRLQYLMVDGQGDPNTAQEFSEAIKALYPVAYKLKFASKIALGKDYVVPPLEGLWWANDMEVFTAERDKSRWQWTLMVMTPDWITSEMFQAIKDKIATKEAPAFLEKVRLEFLEESTCVQTLHLGSFDDEGPVLAKMHEEFIPQNGLAMIKKHQEIYFSDFRKVAPGKFRTILRQPVQPASK